MAIKHSWSYLRRYLGSFYMLDVFFLVMNIDFIIFNSSLRVD